MRRSIPFLLVFGAFIAFYTLPAFGQQPKSLRLEKTALLDKIKGGWAGQTIGVTFGGPTEFRYRGTFIQDYQNLAWYDGYVKSMMIHNAPLFDDIYMDITFVEVLERLGMDAPVDSFANAFAMAKYPLWHANQIARYNILSGIPAPESGHWKNNPHADDIDFQIESDFAGLMHPGMPNSASNLSDNIGHIMNYGDGWYGGVFVGAMYTQAFISKDVRFIVTEALKTIPEQSDFYQCIQDVVAWHKQYPENWKQTWFEIQQKWAEEVGCPEGVHEPYNIDAKVNAAYVVLGLLYGQGDFTKTLEIATRAGQDSDCNPSSAAGILGTMHGYEAIPAFWKQGLKEAEDLEFKYTKSSLNTIYQTSFKHSLAMIKKNGGKITENDVEIRLQKPEAVRFEKSFEGVYPVRKMGINKALNDTYELSFEGTGIVLVGEAKKSAKSLADAIIDVQVLIDGKPAASIAMPTNYLERRDEIFWIYDLPKGKHTITLLQKEQKEGYTLHLNYGLIYSDRPNDGIGQHSH